ncbi:putative N-ethylmaleimide reductase [Lindgomyces ingoldianus]|uniref:N-ethylmaleimide reductase n=1 Tax=Lindgomyces ingoldianus TaxID=673940 RepID=A0ACB6RD12_9PLEO|nr:putative N-ethylmaleimide reductase [Lindgomyces ingoldianus]KAF2476210.1 putative N-ethylmaleimide reductase [Lindgomyces ingoldianus]
MPRHKGANKSSFREVGNELSLASQFHFFSIQNPDDANDRKARRLARSHAVARGLEKKRRLQQESGHNFRAMSSKDDPSRSAGKRKRSQTLAASPLSLSTDAPDPFQMLAAESPRLQALLSQHKAQQVAEPLFSISDELVFQNFRSVLRKGLDDHALLSAFMLTFEFAVTASSIDREYLRYQNEALSSIRQRMNSLDSATSESTMGAILLLAGIEARLGMPRQVQLHMGAIQRLLDICRRNGVYLSDSIKRAIFWQDLNTSVLTGSSRVVDHTTFSELQWCRDPFSPDFILPPGFQAQSYLLGEGFVEVLKDISALQCIRDSTFFGREDVISMAHIDNHQASIQSRLVSLPNHSSISECCHLAAYLCSAMLRCKLWRASTVPSHLSLQLLCKLQQTNNDLVWDDRLDLLAWLLHIGGAFSPTGTIRSNYVVLLHLNRSTRLRGLYTSWLELLTILKQFIWSEKAFMSQKSLTMPQSRLFKPLKIGDAEVQHRIGMAPLTRFRATDDRVPTPLMKKYYGQRAAVPGTLIITEGTLISAAAGGGFTNAPGLWREDQVVAWRTITDDVHSKGSFIFCQLFAMGRAADVETAGKEGFSIVAPSAIPMEEGAAVPHAMAIEEIQQTVQEFVGASKNAIRAGFDGVEIHGANGYLLDQFLQDVSNTRHDAYGGSVENRSRLLDDVLKAVANAIGPQRVGLRLSPWSTFQGMRMADPIPQFTDIIVKARRSDIEYLHLVESRISGSDDYEGHEQLDFAYKLWDGPLLVAGGYTPQEAKELVDEMYPDKEILVLFGRYFIANPDLVFRIRQGLELNAYDRSTFYVAGSPAGYVDYSFSEEYIAERRRSSD